MSAGNGPHRVHAASGGLDGGGYEELPGKDHFMRATWRKSSWSSMNGNCVECAELDSGLIGVRDTKDHGRGPVLVFDKMAWRSFIGSVKKGS
jgi:uncharacterized protein DUF397